jgi:surface antigen
VIQRALILAAVGVLSTLASAQQSDVIALPAVDREIADATRLKALESALSKAVVAWKGASPGISGSVTPLRTYLARNGMMCREFEEATQVPETGVVLNRLACRDEQGKWHLVR